VFAVVELVALVGIFQYARNWWFYFDEWDFLATRTAGSLHDLFRPHNEHWVTVPVLVYRALWQVFGLRHYWPYLLVTVLLHLTLAALLVVMMKRCGVRPTIAVAAGSLFVLFGRGYQDIAWAFQMTFIGSLVFGYVQLLCATKPGPLARSDRLGLGAGFVGLMCSGIALPMIVLVGIATYMRRGARIAAFHVVPLVVAFAIWYMAIGKQGNQHAHGGITSVLHYSFHALFAAFVSIGSGRVAAWLLFAMLVAGSALAWQGPWRRGRVPLETAVPIASLVALVGFVLIDGWGRVPTLGVTHGASSRYLHIYAAFLLVPLAVAAEAVARRWKWFVFAALVLFLSAIPGNVSKFINYERQLAPFQQTYRAEMLWTPLVPGARAVSPDLLPEPFLARGMTLGWLINSTKDGKVPAPPPNSHAAFEYARKRLNFAAFAAACRHHPAACKGTPARP
jgi:hypothetical protein